MRAHLYGLRLCVCSCERDPGGTVVSIFTLYCTLWINSISKQWFIKIIQMCVSLSAVYSEENSTCGSIHLSTSLRIPLQNGGSCKTAVTEVRDM